MTTAILFVSITIVFSNLVSYFDNYQLVYRYDNSHHVYIIYMTTVQIFVGMTTVILFVPMIKVSISEASHTQDDLSSCVITSNGSELLI